jgi:hypothetical protein
MFLARPKDDAFAPLFKFVSCSNTFVKREGMAPSRAIHAPHEWAVVRLQSWFRMCLVRNVLFVAKQRFNIAANAINLDIQRLCPGYTYQEGIDCILM